MLPLRFKPIAAVAFGACLVVCGGASANPFPEADLANGRELHHSKRCVACHTEKTQRDEAFIYQRDDRKVRTLFDLRRYVSLCNMELKLELFPEDERDVAAYLNQQFYKLTR
jgi:mono/diheme cytochrome c family protein